MTIENREDVPGIEHEELCDFVVGKTGLDRNQIDIILEFGIDFVNAQEKDEDGVIRIDTNEQVACIKNQCEVTLTEEQIELVLDFEMEFLVEKGIAGPDQGVSSSSEKQATDPEGFVACFSKISPLLMIRLPPIYLHRPINLLHQHQPHQLMRQRHAPEA